MLINLVLSGDFPADVVKVPVSRGLGELRVQDVLAQPAALCRDRQLSQKKVRPVCSTGSVWWTIIPVKKHDQIYFLKNELKNSKQMESYQQAKL